MTRARKTQMTTEQLLALPSAVDLVTAGHALGIARTTAYALAKADEFPVPVLRLGHTYRVPTAHLLRFLGVDVERMRCAHTDDTPVPTCDNEASNRHAMSRKSIDPEKHYRLRVTGEVISGAEVLRRRQSE